MKKEIIMIALIGVLFILVLGCIIGSVTFYKEYKDKVDYLEQQAQSGKGRLDGVESKIENFKASVDDMNTQVKGYSDNIKSIQNTITLSEDERKSLLAKIEDMKKDLVGMQKDYSSTVVDIRQSMMVLKDELEKMGGKARDIELGKITVKQDEKIATPAPASVPPKDNKKSWFPQSTKTSGSNISSGSVRKVASS